MGSGMIRDRSGTAFLDATLGVNQAGVEVPLLDRSVPAVDVLDEVVVVAVEAMKNVLRELLIAKRLPNGRQCVRECLHLVEVVMRRGVKLLAVTELAPKSRAASSRLLRERVLERAPYVEGGRGEENQTGNALRQGRL
jgi:hypothetical protein